MGIKLGREYLTKQDLILHSIWRFDDADDLTYPVTCTEDFPEAQYDLSIRVKFTTPSGIDLLGYTVGIKNIFAIAIYVGDQIFYFNRNLPGDYPEDLDKLSEALGQKVTIDEFSPLKFVTDIDLDGFTNIEGEFDLLKIRTEKERMEGL